MLFSPNVRIKSFVRYERYMITKNLGSEKSMFEFALVK